MKTVKVVAIESPGSRKPKRLGFLEGCFTVRADFNRMGEKEIKKLFDGTSS